MSHMISKVCRYILTITGIAIVRTINTATNNDTVETTCGLWTALLNCICGAACIGGSGTEPLTVSTC